jgi:hypothetical protein
LKRSDDFFSTWCFLQETKESCNQYTVSRMRKRQAAPVLKALLVALDVVVSQMKRFVAM